MKYLVSVGLVSGVLLLAGLNQPAYANINLELRADKECVFVGDTVTISLYAVSDNNDIQLTAAMDVIVVWDPTVLNPISYTDSGNGYTWLQSGFIYPGGLNASLSDGDAIWTAFAQPGNPAPVPPPPGLKVTTFKFVALQTTNLTTIGMERERGGYMTIVYDGTIPGLDVTGTLTNANQRIGDKYKVHPDTFSLNKGSHLDGSLADLVSSNDEYMRFASNYDPTVVGRPILTDIVFTLQSPVSPSCHLAVRDESHANIAGTKVEVRLWDFNNSNWVSVIPGTVIGQSDTLLQNSNIPNPDSFVSSTGEIRLRRVNFNPNRFNLFQSYIDWVEVEVGG